MARRGEVRDEDPEVVLAAESVHPIEVGHPLDAHVRLEHETGRALLPWQFEESAAGTLQAAAQAGGPEEETVLRLVLFEEQGGPHLDLREAGFTNSTGSDDDPGSGAGTPQRSTT